MKQPHLTLIFRLGRTAGEDIAYETGKTSQQKEKDTMGSKVKVNQQKNRIRVLFLFPLFAFLGVFIFYSIFSSFRISLYNWSGIGSMTDFIGLGNWGELIRDAAFYKALKNNFILMAISIAGQTPISLCLAFFLDRKGKKANFFKVVWFLPLLMSSVAVGTLFSSILDPNFGVLTAILKLFGKKGIILLGNPKYALVTVALVIVWQYVPFYMVYFLAGLGSVPEEIYEAAVIDGANDRQYFFQCALPMLWPSIRNALVLQIVGSMKHFDLIYMMTGGGPSGSTELMATYMYKKTFPSMQMGYGATVACAMFILITIVSLTVIRLLRRGDD